MTPSRATHLWLIAGVALLSSCAAKKVASVTDPAHGVSAQATNAMVFNADNGFLFGPYHPHYEYDPRGR
jgi:hypothetical protein